MKFNDIQCVLKNIPYMSVQQGKFLHEFILENNIKNILELGTANGTGTCYMASALDKNKDGKVTTIDKLAVNNRSPNVQELGQKFNPMTYINPIIANSTYNWELMKLIDQNTVNGKCKPIFDFCYIDGAHNFEIDCCAFFLVDKLLKPNSFLLFDDLYWTYAKSPSLKNTDFVKKMTNEEKNTPHIKKLVELIVLPHPNYHQASHHDAWFLIRKKGEDGLKDNKAINLKEHFPEKTLTQDLKNIAIKLKNKILI